LSRAQQVPLAIHVAETQEELELLARHDGPFVPFLTELGVWDEEGLAKDIQEVLEPATAGGKSLFVHGNYLDPNLSFPQGASLVYCPRTHAFFGHAPHPFRQFLAKGIRVVLGTDSLASNPDLDVLAEARYLHRHYPDVAPAALLSMITLWGAEALGWEKETGSLGKGKSADLVVVPLTAGASSDPFQAVLSSSECVQRVLFRGKWVHRA
jgi:cytosine/adenosine deaminase-related metal-dependent hydrolase